MTTGKVYPLKGVIQHYSWGGNTYIPSLLGIENASHQPFAEYWLGAHDKAPAMVQVSENEQSPISDLINKNAKEILGEKTLQDFNGLPYLLKVLDVKDMLSIQVHPNKKNAAADFARENELNIPIDSPKRNYKDANHKPELMVALSDFWLLHGFKKEKELKKVLENVPELKPLSAIFSKEGYEGLYKHVMNMPQPEVNDMLQPLLQRVISQYHQHVLDKNSPDFWAARAALTFNEPGKIDRGIFSIYFFNLVYLKQGEAIYQDAGIPHAYLEGQNVEIMANSDNVLRGGLTPKHIDVTELMRHTKFEAVVPRIIQPLKKNHQQIFYTEAKDFELSFYELGKGEMAKHRAHTLEILLVMAGVVTLKEEKESIELTRGQSALLFSDAVVEIKASENAQCYLASLPIHNG